MKIRRMIVDEVDVDEFDVDDEYLGLAKMMKIRLLPITEKIQWIYLKYISHFM